MVIIIQFRRDTPVGAGDCLGLAVEVLQLLLDGSQFLSEKVLLLLLGEGLVDDGGDLAADFGDGCEFDEQLGSNFEPGLSVGCGQDLCAGGQS